MNDFFRALRAVLFAFIGIRRKGDANADSALRPLPIIIAGLLCAAILVTTIIFVVRTVIGSA